MLKKTIIIKNVSFLQAIKLTIFCLKHMEYVQHLKKKKKESLDYVVFKQAIVWLFVGCEGFNISRFLMDACLKGPDDKLASCWKQRWVWHSGEIFWALKARSLSVREALLSRCVWRRNHPSPALLPLEHVTSDFSCKSTNDKRFLLEAKRMIRSSQCCFFLVCFSCHLKSYILVLRQKKSKSNLGSLHVWVSCFGCSKCTFRRTIT